MCELYHSPLFYINSGFNVTNLPLTLIKFLSLALQFRGVAPTVHQEEGGFLIRN